MLCLCFCSLGVLVSLEDLCFFADDGMVRIWRNFEKDDANNELVTSFVALTDMVPLSKGDHRSTPLGRMLMSWY